MRLLSVLALVLVPLAVRAQESLESYLKAEAKKHFDVRRQLVANLKTPDEIRKRQEFLKEKFLEALGGFPEKTPLRAKVVGTLRGDGFRVEKVIYESRPNHHVTANLYLPEGQTPVPGVLLPCGHSDNGKAAEAYQRACILMARNGLAVLCYDPIGQGERNQLLDKAGKPPYRGTSEHTMIGIGALLVGQNTATYRIWDGIRSLDYLASRPEIDPKRLGCTGNSGGGTLTSYLMALDERIVAAAPSCYLTTLEKLFATIGPQDAEQNITGQVAFGMEHADFITMRAPRPTLMCVASRDFFDIDGAWTTFREASLIYAKLGHGERVALFEFEDKHGFSKPRREAALRWLRRWLLGKDDAPTEGNFKTFTDAELQCTRSGQVLEDFKGVSAFHLNAEKAKELAERRSPLWRDDPDKARQTIRKVIGVAPRPPHTPQTQEDVLAHLFPDEPAKRNGVMVSTTSFETEPGIRLPMAFFWPEKGRAEPILYVHEEGFGGEARPGGAIDKLVHAGKAVVAVDLRGLGETAQPKASVREAFLALHLNRPLLGQRALDLLRVVDFWTSATGEIEVLAVGNVCPIALHAAALDPRISKVTLEKGLLSWQNVVQTPLGAGQLGNVVPGALSTYDLPDLAALIAPRALTIRGAVDARGQPVERKELEFAYKACRERFGQLNKESNLVLERLKNP